MSIDIKIDEQYRIRTDRSKFNLMLVKRGVAGPKAQTPGEETEHVLGYYGSLESLLRGLSKHRILNADAETIADLKAVQQTTNRLIENLGNELYA